MLIFTHCKTKKHIAQDQFLVDMYATVKNQLLAHMMRQTFAS